LHPNRNAALANDHPTPHRLETQEGDETLTVQPEILGAHGRVNALTRL